MADQDILNHLASTACPITSDAKSSCNDQFADITPCKAAADQGDKLAHKVFDQIQGASDGSLTTCD